MCLDNPYIYDRPLTDREQFRGRRSEIMRIYSRVAADRPQSVSIVGELRTGKTSLLNWLCNEASREEILDDPSEHVYVLLPLMENPPDSPEAFFARMDEALQEAVQVQMTHSYSGFRDLVERLMEERRKLVLFCDDFHVVTQNASFPLDFFSFLRSMANNNDVGYVTTSSAALQDLCVSQDVEESPFFNIFTPVNLGPLKNEDARNLVCRPAETAGEPFGEEADWILELGGRTPYLLQLTAFVAFAVRAKGTLSQDCLAGETQVEAEGYLQKLWEGHFTEVQQDVLRSVCASGETEPRLRYAAEDLKRMGYLQSAADGYGFGPGLLRRFVEERSEGAGLWNRLFRRNTGGAQSA